MPFARMRRLAAFLLLHCLAACGTLIDIQRAERPDRPIPAATLIGHRDPVAIDLIIPRAQLATIAGYDKGLMFHAYRCDDSFRTYMSELFFEGTPIRRETDEVIGKAARTLLLREAEAKRKGQTAAITVLIPRYVLDGERYLCGIFEYAGPRVDIFRMSWGPRSLPITLPPPTPAQIAARTGLRCAFVPKGGKEVEQFERCADLDHGGNLDVTKAAFERLTFETDGLARIYVNGWYVVSMAGYSAPIATFDNAPEDFVDGVARSPRGTGIGYIDRELNSFGVADGALPFRGGVGTICDGCTLRSDGEHSWYEGGRWLCLTGKDEAIFPYRPLKSGETPETLCDPYRKPPGTQPAKVSREAA